MTHVVDTPSGGATAPPIEAKREHADTRRNRACRALCHLVAEGPLLVVALVQLAQGWRATQDQAVIAIRSWAVLSSNSPLVGQITQASGCSNHNAYSPGPLQYWLLAVPVRLDPAHGALWGAALAGVVAMAISVEAAWAVRGPIAAMVLAAGSVVLFAMQTQIVINPIWNPYLGVLWFVATCMAAWAVGCGRLRWWPLLVVAASVAAQTHLEFAIGAVVLALAAPVVGLFNTTRSRQRRWGWAVAGLVAGAVCWAAPLVQQFTTNPGNLTVLLRCAGNRSALGADYGLRTLGSAVTPSPLWSEQPPPGNLLHILSTLGRGSAVVGGAVLAALACLAIGAWMLRRRELAVLAGVALIASGSAAWVIAAVPKANALEIAYLDVILWPVGMLVWAVAGWACVDLATVAWKRVDPVRKHVDRRPVHVAASKAAHVATRTRLFVWSAWVLMGGLLVGAIASTAITSSGAMAEAASAADGSSNFAAVTRASSAVQRTVPRGPIVLAVLAKDGYASYVLQYGILWNLISDGRQATAPGIFRPPIEPPAYLVGGETNVTVTVTSSGRVSKVVTQRPSR